MKRGDAATKDEEFKKGDRVRRVLVESLIWDSLNPTRVLPLSELIKVSETKDGK